MGENSQGDRDCNGHLIKQQQSVQDIQQQQQQQSQSVQKPQTDSIKASNKSTSLQHSRFADYFVICGLDLDTGLETDRFAGKIKIITKI